MSGSVFIGPGFYARLALAGCGLLFPLQFAGFRIARLHEARVVHVIAANSGNHMIPMMTGATVEV